MSDSIRLHFHPVSPSSRAVLAGLHHLGSPADVEFVEVDIRAGESQLPSYRALNPNGMIPCLEVGDFRLWESGAILQYLADRYGPSELYPTALEARANVNRWIQ
ncbi:MAG: glutathione S-transferase family protein, partial [Myxococcota bacterium]